MRFLGLELALSLRAPGVLERRQDAKSAWLTATANMFNARLA